MRKLLKIIFILSCILANNDIYAQMPQPALARDYSKRTAIDTVQFKVTYYYRTRIFTERKTCYSDIQTLETGLYYSRYYSQNAELIDSLSLSVFGTVVLGKDSQGYSRTGTYEDIYWNYPSSGEISVYNRYVRRTYLYSEPLPKQEWKMSRGADTTILGHKCYKATTSFRGRRWNVWFSPEIPIPYGPWKLSGLPGLILKAEDEDKYFSYEACGLEQNTGEPMMKYEEPAQECSREQILIFNDLRWKDSSFLIKLMSGNEVITVDPNEASGMNRVNSRPVLVIPQKETE